MRIQEEKEEGKRLYQVPQIKIIKVDQENLLGNCVSVEAEIEDIPDEEEIDE